jgi:hypothetical protein
VPFLIASPIQALVLFGMVDGFGPVDLLVGEQVVAAHGVGEEWFLIGGEQALCWAGSAGRRCCRAPFAAFALAAVYGGVLLALHRATRTSHLPFGPFILLGALAAIAL